MKEYYFLFGLAFIWMVFATVQDLKSREVANWLNFSLIGFALAYRAFYSAAFDKWEFFLFGILGFSVFFVLAHLMYYGKIFAGGDAKLLMALGVILPFEKYRSLLFDGLGFIFVLFFVGAVYSLAYSVFLVNSYRKSFKDEFVNLIGKFKGVFLLLGIISISLFFFMDLVFWSFVVFFVFLAPLLCLYLMALEKGCMIRRISPSKLTEGDWLAKDIKIGRSFIRKSVHGLSFEDIKRLKKNRKKVLIREGIPFTPAFLITFLIMVYAFLVLGFSFEQALSSLL